MTPNYAEVKSRLTQQEFDEMPGIIVHLLIDGTNRALCSGEEIDTGRWSGADSTRKQCQACYYAAQQQMRGQTDADHPK